MSSRTVGRRELAALMVAEPVKVLLVDDFPDQLLAMASVLESPGQEVIAAGSGRQALRCLAEQDFAVILLDAAMPEMDGFETATLIRRRNRSRRTPIIFLGDFERGGDQMRRLYGLGAVDCITRPFVPEILRTKVAVLVELHRKWKTLERRNLELRRALDRSWHAAEEIRALNRRVERLDELNRELEAFSYTVSHELRGPLSRMAGFSKALLEFHTAQLNEEAQSFLTRIDQSAGRMCDLVEALLNVSRLARVEMREQDLNLSSMVAGLAAELQAQEPGRTVDIRIAADVHAWGDPTLLRMALENLLANAWKFTGKNASAQIEFGRIEAGEGPVYFLRDDGVGFDRRDAARLFNPFQRLHKEPDFDGSGIGLATVERVIRRHGGRIWAEGEVERGAALYFTHPRERAK
jgi:two-component system sensor histidine kinase/response regulator